MKLESLRQLAAPHQTVLLTQECQEGVIGETGAWPALADAAKATNLVANVNLLASAGRSAGVQILHAIAARREDGKGRSNNAPLFQAAERSPIKLLTGGPMVELATGLERSPLDLVSTRIFGLSPITGTDVNALLRNVGCRTLVIVGVSSNVAIPAAVLEAVGLGYQVIVVRDAIAGTPVEYTDVIIRNTLSLVANIVTSSELVEAWSEVPVPTDDSATAR